MVERNDIAIEELFEAGAHLGYSKSRRHPSMKRYIFGVKDRVEIIDLDKTKEALSAACAYARELGSKKQTLLFVGTKPEVRDIVKDAAERAGAPYVTTRWIGGLITNFDEVKKRIARLTDLLEQREKGELSKYTKKERLMIDREIEKLSENFGGVVSLKGLPQALFVVDPRNEDIAVEEARKKGIAVIALSGSDCDVSDVQYPIPGNDAARASVQLFVDAVRSAYEEGVAARPAEEEQAQKDAAQEKGESATEEN